MGNRSAAAHRTAPAPPSTAPHLDGSNNAKGVPALLSRTWMDRSMAGSAARASKSMAKGLAMPGGLWVRTSSSRMCHARRPACHGRNPIQLRVCLSYLTFESWHGAVEAMLKKPQTKVLKTATDRDAASLQSATIVRYDMHLTKIYTERI